MTAHCFWCEAATHIGDVKRTALCDCCRQPVVVTRLSVRHWCQMCELECRTVMRAVWFRLAFMAAMENQRCHCVTIDVDGEPVRAHFDRDPTREDLDAVAAIARSVRRHFNELPTEVIAAEEWYRRALAQHRKDHAP